MPFVYFIHEEGDTTTFKIGKTENHPADRMEQLQTGNPRKLRLYRWICIADHSTAEEYLHLRFNESHIRGEWFLINPELIDEECEIISQNDENARVSGAWESYTDSDRLQVKISRAKSGKYRGKKSPEENHQRRNHYLERQQLQKIINAID